MPLITDGSACITEESGVESITQCILLGPPPCAKKIELVGYVFCGIASNR